MADLNVTRFVIDGNTYVIPSASATQKGLMSSSDYQKLAAIDENAEVNVIESVKVNNTALTVSNKAVNLAIEEGTSNGSVKVNGTDVAVHGLQGLAYKSSVSTSELETTLADTISNNTSAISTLNGASTLDGSVAHTVNAALNDFATKVSNDNVVNTYKELVDWAAEHGGEAATMAGDISALEGLLTGIGGEDQPATVVAAISTSANGKVDKVTGYGLSKNDFTDALKNKLEAISEGANKVTYSYDSATETLTLSGITATAVTSSAS